MSDLSAIFLPLLQSPEFKESLKSALREVMAENHAVPDPSPVFFNRGEVSRMLHISLPTLDTYVRNGLIPAKKIGNRFLFIKDDIESCLTAPTFRKYKRRKGA
jgi:hypothetical protein